MLPNTKPAKKRFVGREYSRKQNFKTELKNKILNKAPLTIGVKKIKFFFISLPKLFIASIKLSKIPKITAIVPPLTPGIIFAKPIKMPFKNPKII